MTQDMREISQAAIETAHERICSDCRRTLPLTEFNMDKSRKYGRSYLCKECDKKDSKKFYRKNLEYFKNYNEENRNRILLYARVYNFLHRNARTGGYLRGTGICVFCGEINPFLLELHHPFGPDHQFKIHECANCHSLQHRFPALLEVTL